MPSWSMEKDLAKRVADRIASDSIEVTVEFTASFKMRVPANVEKVEIGREAERRILQALPEGGELQGLKVS